jgi:hypothetical protein
MHAIVLTSYMDTSFDIAHAIVVISHEDTSSDIATVIVVISYMDMSSDVAHYHQMTYPYISTIQQHATSDDISIYDVSTLTCAISDDIS